MTGRPCRWPTATACTGPSWPVSGPSTGSPESRSHTRTDIVLIAAAGDDHRAALPLAHRHRVHRAVVAPGDVVRVGPRAANPARRPRLVQRQLVELAGQRGMVTAGGQLQVAGPLTGCAGVGAQVRVGVTVDLGVAGGRLAGALQRGEQPSRVGRDEKRRIIKKAGELASVGGVPGQLAVQVGLGGQPVRGAVGMGCHGAEQALVDGLRGADPRRILLVAFAEQV